MTKQKLNNKSSLKFEDYVAPTYEEIKKEIIRKSWGRGQDFHQIYLRENGQNKL